MNIVKTVAKMRLNYHLNMLDVCNVLNQLHILSNRKANKKMKNHLFECLDAMEHLDMNLDVFNDDEFKSL